MDPELTTGTAPTLSQHEFNSLVTEVCTTVSRMDLEDTLKHLGSRNLSGWELAYDPSRKKTLEGFVRLCLADLLTVHILESEDETHAASAAAQLHHGPLCQIAKRMAHEHRRTSADFDDLVLCGQLSVFRLMALFTPKINPSFYGYAFGKNGRPSLVELDMLDDLCRHQLKLSEHAYRSAKDVRSAMETFFKTEGLQPTEAELGAMLGIKRLNTVKRHLTWKATAFDGLLQPGRGSDGDGDPPNDDDRGPYGEAEMDTSPPFCAGRLAEILFGLRLLEELSPNQAYVLRHALGVDERSEHGEPLCSRMSNTSYRQTLHRARRRLGDILRFIEDDGDLRKLAERLRLSFSVVERTYKDCVGF